MAVSLSALRAGRPLEYDIISAAIERLFWSGWFRFKDIYFGKTANRPIYVYSYNLSHEIQVTISSSLRLYLQTKAILMSNMDVIKYYTTYNYLLAGAKCVYFLAQVFSPPRVSLSILRNAKSGCGTIKNVVCLTECNFVQPYSRKLPY
jgi:hypothetical protein